MSALDLRHHYIARRQGGLRETPVTESAHERQSLECGQFRRSVPLDGRTNVVGGFMGRHTLEGSRPGASAAACWLAHRAVPLSQKGHGKVLAASILATREMYGALEARSSGQRAVKIAFINKPHTNMICYLPYHVDSRNLEEAGAVCDAVAAKLSPAHQRDFMVVQTTLRIKATEEWMADRFVPSCAQRFLRALGVTTDIDVPVLRSVVMGPLALGATTELNRTETRGRLDLYSEHLVDLTESAFLALRTTGS